MKIGVFDSGIGGLTVLRELTGRFPGARYVYYGDTAHVPYGTKSLSQIKSLSSHAATLLKTKNLDVLVVACNTASCLALSEIREIMKPTPVVGMVEPGVQVVLESIRETSEPDLIPVLVLGTPATINSGVYGSAIRRVASFVSRKVAVTEVACPLLVPMIEEGWVNHPILQATVEEYLSNIKEPSGIALLACTHYPWIQTIFESQLPGWKVINSARAVSQYLKIQPLAGTLGLDRSVEWIFTDPNAVPSFVWKELSPPLKEKMKLSN